MAFNWELMVPYKYGNVYVSLRTLEQIMVRSYNREYMRRFLGWLHYKNGYVGAGGLSRTEQPTGPTFAPSLYVSFHWAGQEYNDGTTGACAVDTLVQDGPDPGDAHDSIPWREVPIQGSAEAVKWGIHANVGSPTGVGLNESWHIQPIEIDGHGSWVKAGRPAPVVGYPIPVEHDPYAITTPDPDPIPPIIPTPGDEDMGQRFILTDVRHDITYLVGATGKTWIDDGNARAQIGFRVAEALGQPVDYTKPAPPLPDHQSLTDDASPIDGFRYAVIRNGDPTFIASYGPIVGPRPAVVDEYGR